MALFGKKKQSKPLTPDEVAARDSAVFDEPYRQDLRERGRHYFNRVMDDNTIAFKQALNDVTGQVATELNNYMHDRLDETITRIDSDVAKKLDERLQKYDAAVKDAQDQAVQSLNRNAHALYERYRQLEQSFQLVVTNQQSLMNSLYEKNKSRLTEARNAQDETLKALKDSSEVVSQRSTQAGEIIERAITEQVELAKSIFKNNQANIASASAMHDQALQSLSSSVEALEKQQEELRKAVAKQETVLVDGFRTNMASIIEHYVRDTLGQQFDVSAQLPSIIQQLEANKQSIEDDMKL